MPLDSISQARLAEVHPELARRVTSLDAALEAEGYTMRVTQGVRTVAQQDADYAEGRTAPGKIVTNACGSNSNHVLGFAADQCVMVDGEPVWDASHPGYKRQIALAGAYGLRSGAEWGDDPHLELSDVPAKPNSESQAAYAAGGIAEVWKQTNIPPWNS